MLTLIRRYLGAILYDVPRAIRTVGHSDLQRNRLPWVNMCNRDQTLVLAQDGPGVQCDWEWTSDLYLPKLFPAYGRWLYRRALEDFPISFKERPESGLMDKPQVSFIIGHRSRKRLPLLLATLKSIAAQKDCLFECIVVEQDNEPLVKDDLPEWVRYIHTLLPDKDMAYSRSWAFNVGAKAAKSELLIFHDNDLLVPEIYGKELLKYFHQGYEVINLKRFIFYLDEVITNFMCNEENRDISTGVETIMQNAEGGGSICISRQAYYEIGGFDERFVGWGGEDNEFWERANTKKVYPFGYLPIVHLWHSPQPEKNKSDSKESESIQLYRQLSNVSVENRIRKLTSEI